MANYDTLTIEIGANVSGASNGIRTLKNNLNALQKIVNNLDFSLFTKLEKHLQNIANIDFTNVSKGLQDVVSAFKSLNSEQKKFTKGSATLKETPYQADNLPTVYGDEAKLGQTNFDLPHDQVPSIDLSPLKNAVVLYEDCKKNVDEFIDSAKNIIDVDAHFRTLEGDLERAGFSIEQIKEVVRSTNVEAKLFSAEGLQQVRDILLQWNFSGEEADRIIKRLKTDVASAGKQAEKGAKGFHKIVSAFKRILFYRVVRRVIQLVGQAIVEAIKNMALFDEQFNASMSEIKSSFNYLKNSLGTLFAPIIETIQPILTTFLDTLAEVNNIIAETFAMLQGKNQFAKATKGAEDYAESLKKAKNVSLGIDELNVIQKDDEQNFEMVDIEPSELANEMQEAGESIKTSFTEIMGSIKELLVSVLTPVIKLLAPIFNLLKPIFNIVSKVVNLASKLVSAILPPVIRVLGVVVNIVARVVEIVSPLVDLIVETLEPIIDIIGFVLEGVANTIDDIYEAISPILDIVVELFGELFQMGNLFPTFTSAIQTIKSVLEPVFKFIHEQFELIGNVFKLVVALIKGDWASLGDIMKNIMAGVINGVIGMFEAFINIFVGAINGITRSLSKIWTWLGIPAIPEIPKADFKRVSFEQGGFPEDGFFFANHNELVGQFSNGQTAVANNEQIVEGIKQGVIEALQISGANNGEANREIVIQIDGREIGRASEKYQRQLGAKIFSGGSGYGN